jgi:superoxide dismutase, Fe-Mn family
MSFKLPELPYKMDALEPYISKTALETHQEKHKSFITSLNNLITGTKFENTDLETIIKIADGPVFTNASQTWNHKFYFEGLTGAKNKPLSDSFREVVNINFGSFTFLKSRFIKAATSSILSGWVWLVINPNGTLEIVHESNSGNPLRKGLIPLMACDVWEHAYYLDYQNRRTDYLEAFWKLIDWGIIEKRYNNAI